MSEGRRSIVGGPTSTALLHFCADQLAEVIQPADTGDLRKDLLTVFEPLAELSYGDGPLALLAPTFIAAAAHDEQMRTFVADNVASRRSGAIVAFAERGERGELRQGVNINLTVDMIAGALSDRGLPSRQARHLRLCPERHRPGHRRDRGRTRLMTRA